MKGSVPNLLLKMVAVRAIEGSFILSKAAPTTSACC
jgi:hypothetical protein